MAEPVASRAFHHTVAENVSTVVASQANLGCFDSSAACAALPLSMTGVEKINKVTYSERREANAERSRRTPRARKLPRTHRHFETTTPCRHPP